jgi:hypothetical protein
MASDPSRYGQPARIAPAHAAERPSPKALRQVALDTEHSVPPNEPNSLRWNTGAPRSFALTADSDFNWNSAPA